MLIMQYAKFVKPAFDDFVLPSKKYADVIIPRGGDNHVAIDLIVQHIRTKLGQHDLCKIYPNVYVIQSTFQVCLLFYMRFGVINIYSSPSVFWGSQNLILLALTCDTRKNYILDAKLLVSLLTCTKSSLLIVSN